MLEQITPVVLTLDEAPNIGRTLQGLAWARRVVVLDSGSTDGTQEIVARHANAELYSRAFDGLAAQWNWAMEHTGIDTEWILALDADYLLPPEFVEELKALSPGAGVSGYRARFRYCVEGTVLRGALYPPVTVLFRKAAGRYVQDGHAHRIRLEGQVEELWNALLHDDRKPLVRWFASQVGYMREEARHLLGMPRPLLRLPDRIRLAGPFAPLIVLFYCLFVRGNLLDGRHGLLYALQRTVAEVMLFAFLAEARLSEGAGKMRGERKA